MKRLLLTIHWINLDTAIGAVITSLFISICLETTTPPVASVTLLLAVLSIYNFDHLMDARRVTTIAKSARHRFYQENQLILSIYQLVLMLGLITIIWYLPASILRAGLVLALVTGIYFILLFFIFPKRFMLKEVMISVVYSLALFLAPIYANNHSELGLYTALLWLEILLLAIANTLIFAWYDHEIDVSDGHTSLAGELGRSMIYRIVLVVLFLTCCLVAYQIFDSGVVLPQLIILAMAVILFIGLLANRKLSLNERYRIVGDAIFIIPIVIFFL